MAGMGLKSPRLVSGVKKLGWLKALKSSKRNWKRMVSVIFHHFCNPISQFTKPGARRSDRNLEVFPNVNGAGSEKAAALIQPLIHLFCATGLTPATHFGTRSDPHHPSSF